MFKKMVRVAGQVGSENSDPFVMSTLIQPSKTLLVELTETHTIYTHVSIHCNTGIALHSHIIKM